MNDFHCAYIKPLCFQILLALIKGFDLFSLDFDAFLQLREVSIVLFLQLPEQS